ncbi:WD repeat-containing protein 6 isoform X2 [Odontomachus brunneus]|uniref:WD repeat-containing protein 6 isoform X2 n=1 Tax=Odontomachus brunneus TaxID=486640 RepID=UPI0013F1BB74|nr:WD repeat-containing protein 6 isoform X2 [Odontomachus brunneus]
MISKLLRTNVLAVRCVDDLVLIGMGSMLYVFDTNSYQLKSKLNCLYPSNIHGIVVGPNNILAVFGAKSIYICDIIKQEEVITFKKRNNNEFNDWIIALQWISVKKQLQLAILFAHNCVSIYDISEGSFQIVCCEEKCILYGGFISGTLQEDLVIFSGTVFQEILIWKIDNNHDSNKSMPILHRLTGHKGVIFSVVFDPYSHLICSTSDDRTVRLWKVIGSENSESSNINWQTTAVMLVKTMYAHTARVWRAIIKNDIVITIGEDSLMCTWSLSGNLLNKTYAHHGAPIWSIDTSADNKNIFTGGADGAVCVWPSTCYNSPKTISLTSNNTHNIPKYISYLSSGTILIFNEKGTLFCYNKNEATPKDSLYLEKYCSYCIMQVSPCRSFVAFASRDGYVTLYKDIINTNTKHLHQILEERIMESQIFSLQWLRDDALIVCGANGLLRIFHFTINGTTHVETQCMLPSSRERWLTAATIYEKLLVCGDRTGNVYVFELSNESEDIKTPSQTLVKVHGKIGVQSFDVLEDKLMTTGRDGMLRFYELNKENRNSLLTLHKKKMPMDWISGTLKVDGILLVFGFKEAEFIIYNLQQQRLLFRIPCGGGHRSWDCTILNRTASFAYIRNKQVYIFDYPLGSLKLPILQDGFHVKETCCLQRISCLDARDIFVSGGEDCTLRVSCISQVSQSDTCAFHNLGVFDGHLSVFSGGGRAQLKVWQMNLKYNERVSPSIDLSCLDVKSHMLHGQDQYRKKPWQETEQSYIIEPETRYMDIHAYYPSKSLNHVLIFVACADGYLRIFVYDIKTSDTYLKVSTKYVDRCILKMHVLSHKCKMIVLTMTTDGILRFFDLTGVVSKIYKDANLKNQNIIKFNDAPFAEFNLHQSGINSYDLKLADENKYLLITGGDDNLFNLLCFRILETDEILSVVILSKWSTASAHCAQIAGLKFKDDDQICSVGIDQQVIIYSYSWSSGALSARILSNVFTSITDVQGMDLWPSDNNGNIVCIYGRGFEILPV